MSIRSSLVWVGLAQAGFFVLQFGSSIVVARVLTPHEVGAYAIAISLVGLLNVVQALGLQSLVVRETALTPRLMDTIATVNTILCVALATVIAAVGAFAAPRLYDASVRSVLLAIAVLPLIGIFEFRPLSNLERSGAFRSLAIGKFAGAGTSASVTVALVLSGHSTMSLAYGQILGAAAGTALLNLLGRRFIGFRVSLVGWRQVTRYGSQMLAVSGVNIAASRLSEILISRFLGLGALGLYSRASNLNNLLWDNIHIVLGRVVLVDFVALMRSGTGLRERYLRSVALVTGLLWPAFAGLAVLSSPLIYTLYGQAWVGAALPLSLLAIAAMVLVSLSMTWELFVATGETHRQARIEIIRTGVGVALFAAGAHVSLAMAAAARVADALFSVLLYRPHVSRMTGTRTSDFLPIYARSAVVTVAAVAPVTLLMALYRWSEHTPIAGIGPAVALGGLAWLVALQSTRHPLMDEIRVLLRLRAPAAPVGAPTGR